MSGYIRVYDSLCEGWQCVTDGETGEPWIYETREVAKAEILSDSQEYWDNVYKDDPAPEYPRPETLDDCEDFAVPVNEFLTGRKAIWTGEGVRIEGEPLQ